MDEFALERALVATRVIGSAGNQGLRQQAAELGVQIGGVELDPAIGEGTLADERPQQELDLPMLEQAQQDGRKVLRRDARRVFVAEVSQRVFECLRERSGKLERRLPCIGIMRLRRCARCCSPPARRRPGFVRVGRFRAARESDRRSGGSAARDRRAPPTTPVARRQGRCRGNECQKRLAAVTLTSGPPCPRRAGFRTSSKGWSFLPRRSVRGTTRANGAGRGRRSAADT